MSPQDFGFQHPEEIDTNLAAGDAEGLERAVKLADAMPSRGLSREAIDALYKIAETAERLGRVDLAEAHYRRVVSSATTPPHLVVAANYRLGLCLQGKGSTAEARDCFLAASEARSVWPEVGRLACWELTGLLLRNGDFQAAEPHCRALYHEAECTPLYRPEVQLRLASCQIRLNLPEGLETADICDQLSQIDFCGYPGALNSVFELAIALELSGHYELSNRLYEGLLERKDLHAHSIAAAAYRLALGLEQLGEWDQSMTHYRTAIRLGNGLPQVPTLARTQLGLLLLAAEEYEEAAGIYTELCAAPDDLQVPLAAVQYRRAFCLHHAGNSREAEDVLGEIPRAGTSGAVLAQVDQLLAEIFERRKEYQAALACYQRIVSNGSAEIPVRTAALHRLNMLQAVRV